MPLDTQKALLFGIAAALRLFLFVAFPSLPNLLTDRVEISTPVTSFKRLQEGLYLYTHNVSPYDGGVFHQAPLLLPLFSLLPDIYSFPLATNLVYIAVDLLSANALMQVAETGENVSARLFTSPRKGMHWSGLAIAAGYLFNPFIIATMLGRPTSTITSLLLLTAIASAARGRPFTFVLAISLASYLSLYPLLLFPPLLLLCYDAETRRAKPNAVSNPLTFTVFHTVDLVFTIGSLLFLSRMLMGSWEFISSTYGVHLLLPDLTPNVGLWWYFFIEMFDSFREFFLGVFWLHMSAYVGGLTFRIRRQPLFVVVALLGIFAVFMPYPSIAETGLFLSMIPLYTHVFPLTRYVFLACATLLYASFLGPAFYHLWIYAGSGNANFFYAITLLTDLAPHSTPNDVFEMAPPKSATLSPRDLEVAGKIWLCFKTEPQIDYQKLAQVAGFKNAASASACWGPIKKKLMGQVGDGKTSSTSTPSSARSKRKGSSSYTDDNDDDDEFPSTPTPKAKKAKKAISSARVKGHSSSPAVHEISDNEKVGGKLAVKRVDKFDDEQLDTMNYFNTLDPDEPFI
ncbi:gpi transamidase component pig-u [Botryosphaeria dothidea]|uniref:Gpi transamidase component pig-u n=1 Tax=Botryosphaeria dothidea TaxID=55169 RepID=A0A8H4J2J6_9PEZI|nr:gpi transamidase component pig-u [Botryosphaeria dothidea]